MHLVKPKVFLVGETRIVDRGFHAFLREMGVPNWRTDACTDVEKLIELYGRLCYLSFDKKLNPNLKRVREGNEAYLGNILQSRHGSVTEHALVNFVFTGVSRVPFTQELVRHRVGIAVSQVSLRFVRLDELEVGLPITIQEDDQAMKIFVRTFEDMERLQRRLARHFKLDDPKTSFHRKKEVTSALRRVAPMGLATAIGWSANIRTLRWVIEARTNPEAEVEIREVFGEVARLLTKRYRNLFRDFTAEMADGLPWYKPKYPKV